ncbi:MAG TPA: cytochrome ubiquinol oxidase subunit I [Solirubrobacterales bacterium]|nr:cytochrome ubiquinol oxidase subunit I [Solirubrobacterales bacterium]
MISLVGHLPNLFAVSSELAPARSQMAFTLGFHIILACLGVAFPALMLIANYRGLRRNDADALRLAERWSKVAAVTFAVGAVTGTVLSFEFGLLWPEFTGRFGEVFGILFAIEGIFFFTEAIFLAIYIYGWKRMSGWAHFWTGVPVVISGIGGAYSVVAVNSWMNQPGGFTLGPDGSVTSVDLWKVIFNDAVPYEVPHMILAAYIVTGFLVASVYAVGMLRGRRDRHHRLGLLIPFTVAAIAAPIQFAVGDTAARAIAEDQPVKFAAMECVQTTHRNVTEYIFGICTDDGVKGGIGIPGFDSFLVGFDTDTKVTGLDSVPPDERPPFNTLLHWCFDIMVGIGTALIALGAWLAFVWWRRRDIPSTPWFLRAVAVSGVAAVVALECGWIVTEVGRQPWVVYGVMRTEDAVTGASGVWVTFAATLALYTALGVATVLILRTMSGRWRSADEAEVEVPYGPSEPAPPITGESS